MSSTASRPCLSCPTGSSPGCELPPLPSAGLPHNCSTLSSGHVSAEHVAFLWEKKLLSFISIRHTQEGQAKRVQEVMSATRDGERPLQAAVRTRRQKKSQKHAWSGEVWLLTTALLIQPSFDFEMCRCQDENMSCPSDQIRQYECAWDKSFTSPGGRLLFIGCPKGSSFEHIKTVMASLNFQGKGVANVSTNRGITKSHCLGS